LEFRKLEMYANYKGRNMLFGGFRELDKDNFGRTLKNNKYHKKKK
jgi:hypothetical protein